MQTGTHNSILVTERNGWNGYGTCCVGLQVDLQEVQDRYSELAAFAKSTSVGSVLTPGPAASQDAPNGPSSAELQASTLSCNTFCQIEGLAATGRLHDVKGMTTVCVFQAANALVWH